jgi:tetratricopeptide (TPR) repeat protein
MEPENEKIMANCAYLQAKLGMREAAEQSIDKAIDLTKRSLDGCTVDSEDTNRTNEGLKFLIKLHLRKCELFLATNAFDKAEATIKAARFLDEQNPTLLERAKEIKLAKKMIVFEEKRVICRHQMEAGDYQAALDAINESEKLLDLDRYPLDVLKTSANKVVCFLKLEKFDHVVAETLRALKIITGIKSNYMSKTYVDHKPFLDDLEQKMRMRKAFAFSSMGQVFNAKQEVERVLEINPSHAEAKRILDDFKLAVC